MADGLGFEAVAANGTMEVRVFDVPHNQPEWFCVLKGHPLPDDGPHGGSLVRTVREWAARWSTSKKFPECHSCGSVDTKRIFFTDEALDGKRRWTSETLCLDCHKFTWREYIEEGYQWYPARDRGY